MNIYWKDIENNDSSWIGLDVKIESEKSIKPNFRLEVGGKKRIKLLNQA